MARPALQFLFGLFSPGKTETAPPARPITTTTRIPQPEPVPAFSDLKSLLNTNAVVDDARLEQTADGDWCLRFTLAKSCPVLRIELDHSEPNAQGEFSAWQRVAVGSRTNLGAGRSSDLPVMKSTQTRGLWEWALEDSDPELRAVRPLASRGRFAFVPKGQPEEHLYFVLIWPHCIGSATPSPVLVDETYFRFKDAWAAEAPLAFAPRWRGR